MPSAAHASSVGHASLAPQAGALPGIEAIRAQFPGLNTPTVFLDNAGGSQVPRVVAEAIRDYLLGSYAQLGGTYAQSRSARATVDAAHEFIKVFVNAAGGEQQGRGVGEVVLGASTSMLCHVLAGAFAEARGAHAGRDEIVVSTVGHESNVGPWFRLAQRGFVVKPWGLNRRTGTIDAESLAGLLSPRTRLVVFPHVSNILGEIVDAQALCAMARAAGARSVVDGVAFAPHRAVDVRALGCDFYVYSTYKVYGPHMAALFGTQEAFAELTGPNHFFIDPKAVPYKFELGGVNHEGCAGLVALDAYLRFLVGEHAPAGQGFSRGVVERAFDRVTALELPLQQRLVEFLAQRGDCRIIGPAHHHAGRVSTIAFTHARRRSGDIAAEANAQGLGLRFGSFYSHRLATDLGIDPDDGVVRISLVHYNTLDEVDRAIAFLDRALA